MSGVDFPAVGGRTARAIRKGAADSVKNYVLQLGGTPLVVADDKEVLGVIHLKDVVKGGIK